MTPKRMICTLATERGARSPKPNDRRSVSCWCGAAGSWSAGGGVAGTVEGNPALLPEGGQVACPCAGCRYGPQSLADDQGTLDRRESWVPGRAGGVRLGDESGFGD